jgi:hypothetical protein
MSVFLLRDGAGRVYALSGRQLGRALVSNNYVKQIEAAFAKGPAALPAKHVFGFDKPDPPKPDPPKNLAGILAGKPPDDPGPPPDPPKLELLGAIEGFE